LTTTAGFTETGKISIAINSDNAGSPFYNVVSAALGESLTPASFSKWLGYKKGRWVDGLRFDQPPTKNKKLRGKRGWILQEKKCQKTRKAA
jgi:hypothetical protein